MRFTKYVLDTFTFKQNCVESIICLNYMKMFLAIYGHSHKARSFNDKCDPRHVKMGLMSYAFAQSGQELPYPLMRPRNIANVQAVMELRWAHIA